MSVATVVDPTLAFILAVSVKKEEAEKLRREALEEEQSRLKQEVKRRTAIRDFASVLEDRMLGRVLVNIDEVIDTGIRATFERWSDGSNAEGRVLRYAGITFGLSKDCRLYVYTRNGWKQLYPNRGALKELFKLMDDGMLWDFQ